MEARDQAGTEESPRREFISSPGDVLQIIWRRLWTIALVAVVLTGSALAFSLAQTPTYKSSILIVVGQGGAPADATPGGDIVADPTQLVATVARAVDTLPVAQAVVDRLNLPEGDVPTVLDHMNASLEPGTNFIDVSYTDADPKRAQLVANAIGETFSAQAPKLKLSNTPITAQVWQRATLPQTPASPNPIRNAAVALVIGILLGTALAFVFEYLDYGEAPRKRRLPQRR